MSHPLAPGTPFQGRFVIQDLVSKGDDGILYRVRSSSGEVCALRFANKNQINATLFLRDLRRAGALNHQAAAKLFDMGETSEGELFSLSEWFDAPSVADLMTLGPSQPERVAKMLEEILELLATAHSRQLFHGDIQPRNLFLVQERGAVLANFGFAPKVDGHSLSHELYGSLGYVAPELLDGAPYQSLTDLYSLGVTALALWMATPPFPQEDPKLRLEAQLAGHLSLPKGISESPLYRNVISQMIDPDPESRPFSPGLVLGDLYGLDFASLRGPNTSSILGASVSPPSPSPRALMPTPPPVILGPQTLEDDLGVPKITQRTMPPIPVSSEILSRSEVHEEPALELVTNEEDWAADLMDHSEDEGLDTPVDVGPPQPYRPNPTPQDTQTLSNEVTGDEKKRGSKAPIFIVLALLLLGVGIVGAFLLLGGEERSEKSASNQEEGESSEGQQEKGEAIEGSEVTGQPNDVAKSARGEGPKKGAPAAPMEKGAPAAPMEKGATPEAGVAPVESALLGEEAIGAPPALVVEEGGDLVAPTSPEPSQAGRAGLILEPSEPGDPSYSTCEREGVTERCFEAKLSPGQGILLDEGSLGLQGKALSISAAKRPYAFSLEGGGVSLTFPKDALFAWLVLQDMDGVRYRVLLYSERSLARKVLATYQREAEAQQLNSAPFYAERSDLDGDELEEIVVQGRESSSDRFGLSLVLSSTGAQVIERTDSVYPDFEVLKMETRSGDLSLLAEGRSGCEEVASLSLWRFHQGGQLTWFEASELESLPGLPESILSAPDALRVLVVREEGRIKQLELYADKQLCSDGREGYIVRW